MRTTARALAGRSGRAFAHRRVLYTVLLLAVVVLLGGVLHTAWKRSALKAPAASHLVTDRYGHYLAEVGGPEPGRYGYWPLADVPPRIAAATVALEDRRFRYHPGVDPVAVARALWQNLRSGRVVSGASTIAMQVARMQNPAPRTLPNKAMEAVTAVFMTLRHGRDAVLRQYLRLVPFGNGSHGIAHAARVYLDKPAADLSWAEIAFLSGIPHAPERLDPLTHDGRRRAAARGRRILDALAEMGVIDAGQLDLARRQIGALHVHRRPPRPAMAMHAIMALADRIAPLPETSSRTIAATLDLNAQRMANRHLHRWLSRLAPRGVQHAAILVVDRDDMAVRALVGSAGFFDEDAGALDYTAVRRSPGSVLKPFVYALALDRGVIRPDTVLWDRRGLSAGIDNSDRTYLGPMLPRRALANSRNVPATNLVRTVGLETTYAHLERLGLHADRRPSRHYGIGLAIGTLPVRLRDVVAAYGALANDGLYRPLRWHAAQPTAPGKRVLGADATRLVTAFLSDPMARLPVFSRMGYQEYDFPVATKTGTSQSYADAWNVVYTRDYIVGVWMGRADGGPMKGVSGASGPAGLAHDVLTGLYRLPGTADRPEPFPAPVHYRRESLCSARPSRSASQCPRKLTEWVPTAAGNTTSADTVTALARTTARQASATLRISSPPPGTTVIRNPETPDDLNRLRLTVDAEPRGMQVVWYVDGRPQVVQRADEPFLWPLDGGRHVFQVRLPYRPERSPPLVLTVR
ncbi:Monofunctional biosynthetic peptidoglycan transglycosylase [wastewater metagenome]|uniref:peptidoglycan glycosyltransferase n=2 Tax=unclassified sequences TaxID=12908 RepID=A0A5B8RE78_9ZZZZ|nr:transglycosylase domain-containing protein [Arhodomonas sp. KWT]QEA05794.1 monofunctional biosynthetic peptidoglycan transglycosylase [uncultured organism]